jgi:hypothetical protein
LKPEHLTGDNCYLCSNCKEKYPAEKGLEYKEFPKILLFNCNRFVFDLNTFQRVKVNDEFEFPLEIDMNTFIGKYSEVQQRLKEQQPELFIEKPKPKKIAKKKKKTRTKVRKDKIQEGFQNLHSSRKGKKFQNKKSSKFTKNFLKNRRKMFNKMKKSFNSAPQDEIFVVEKSSKGGQFKMISEVNEIQIHTSVKTKVSKDEKIENERKKSQKISEMLENEQKLSNDKNSNSRGTQIEIQEKKLSSKKENKNEKEEQKEIEKIGIKNTKIESIKNEGSVQKSLDQVKEVKEEIEVTEIKEVVKKDEKQKISKGGLPSNPISPPSTPSHPPQYKAQISPISNKLENLQEVIEKDNLKYYLYSIFIHKGTAYAGHYYIYIKSFETNRWYLFDDSQVKEVNLVNVLQDAKGGGCSHANAYMLAYRQFDKAIPKPRIQEIPELQLENEKKVEIANETLSLGHVESSLQKTEKTPKGKNDD